MNNNSLLVYLRLIMLQSEVIKILFQTVQAKIHINTCVPRMLIHKMLRWICLMILNWMISTKNFHMYPNQEILNCKA
jgi:hypothetical protein